MTDKDVKMKNTSNTNKKEEKKEDDKGDKKNPSPKIIEVVFQEDDAFEEFEMDTWKVDKNTSKQEDVDLWQDDWGDKDVDEDFELELQKEIQSNANKK